MRMKHKDTKAQRHRSGRKRKFVSRASVSLCLCVFLLNTFLLLGAEHHGQVTFGGVPVPGATVTATQGSQTFVAVTDQQGAYMFPDLPEGNWAIQVEMSGFGTLKGDNSTAAWELKMLPVEEIHAEVVHGEAPATPTAAAPTAPAAAPSNNRQGAAQQRPQAGFQRTEVNASTNANAANTAQRGDDPPSPSGAFANLSQEDLNRRAADGLLINGSVNNGAASPFAQLAQFGNNRRVRPLYNGNVGLIFGNAALDARSYSLTGQETPQPGYNHFIGSFNFGGPMRFPGLSRNNAPQFFIGYQRTQNSDATTLTGRMPTAAERAAIPQDQISPQTRALLNLFPLPNFYDNARYNYQVPVASHTHQDSVSARLNKSLNARNQFAGNFDLQSSRNDSSNIFDFLDTTRTFGVNVAANWTTRPTQRFSSTFRVQFSRQATRVTPFFANRLNVSGIAGVTGNNQDPANWGPPTLIFSGGTSPLSDVQYSYNRTQTNAIGYNGFWNRGRHSVTFGADARRQQLNVLAQQDARGTFTFTGAAAGSDLAGFLQGIPDTSSIAFGNADKYFRQNFYDGFVNDDWRFNGSLSIMAGLRWEYETPVSEERGRLVNLSIAKDFSSVTPVIGNGLVFKDRAGIQPRISFAWRPIAASSLIVRGGYGVYRNTNAYQAIATQMAQQSPLSTTLSVQNSPTNPLSLARGFIATQGVTTNTFAIDPNFRVGYVQSWQLSVQRDLPGAMQMTAIYLGTKGTRLPQEFLPNTFPTGALSPTGYVYLSSNGNSIRNAGQIQLRRRLRSGFTASTQYTYAKALDNAPLMSGGIVTATQGGTSIAQDWLNLHAERALSSFDQRHQLTVQTQYTTGVGVAGGALLSGWKGRLIKEWTVTSALTVGSGMPLTPVYFAAVPGIGVTGNLRPDVTGSPVHDAPAGLFLNPAAFRIPAPKTWGNAARNSITGPSQFSLNASLGRTLPWRDRYSIDIRLDATNVLNHVTFKNWNTMITSTQFGLPTTPNSMRTVQGTMRLRF